MGKRGKIFPFLYLATSLGRGQGLITLDRLFDGLGQGSVSRAYETTDQAATASESTCAAGPMDKINDIPSKFKHNHMAYLHGREWENRG